MLAGQLSLYILENASNTTVTLWPVVPNACLELTPLVS